MACPLCSKRNLVGTFRIRRCAARSAKRREAAEWLKSHSKLKTGGRRWGELRPGLCGLHSAPSTLSQTTGGFGRRLGRGQSGRFGGALSYADSGGGWILEGRAFHSDGPRVFFLRYRGYAK